MNETPFVVIGVVALTLGVLSYIGRSAEKEAAFRPTLHFHSESAYRNCAAMGGEAKARGFTRWDCARPASYDQNGDPK